MLRSNYEVKGWVYFPDTFRLGNKMYHYIYTVFSFLVHFKYVLMSIAAFNLLSVVKYDIKYLNILAESL